MPPQYELWLGLQEQLDVDYAARLQQQHGLSGAAVEQLLAAGGGGKGAVPALHDSSPPVLV